MNRENLFHMFGTDYLLQLYQFNIFYYACFEWFQNTNDQPIIITNRN